MKNLLSKLKPFIQVLLYVASLFTIYASVAVLAESPKIPIPFSHKPDTFLKLLSTSAAVLTPLLAWVTSQVNIELFSGPEVAALGYVETFCNVVVEKFNLKPCYMFIPDHLVELNRPEDYAAAIQTRGLTCTYDPKLRVYTVVNPENNKQVYLDFPSTLRNLAKVASQDKRYKNMDKLEENLICSFKKHVEKRLGITYKRRGVWRKLTGLFKSKKRTLDERTDLLQFYFTDPTAIANEPVAGFKQLA